jgi:hypothetical protein
MADQAGRPADWEMAKENIQPLKQGRKMAKLANCLQVCFQRFWVVDPYLSLQSGSGSLFSL